MGLLAVNVLGELSLAIMKSIGIKILYDDEVNTQWNELEVQSSHKLNIFQFELIPNVLDEERVVNKCKNKHPIDFTALLFPSTNNYYNYLHYDDPFQKCVIYGNPEDVSYGLTLKLYQSSYNVSIDLRNMTFQKLYRHQMLLIIIRFCNNSIKNEISIVGCYFEDNKAKLEGLSMINIKSWLCYSEFFHSYGKTKIIVKNCSFIDNGYQSALINITHGDNTVTIGKCAKILNLLLYVHICECFFQTHAKYFISFISYNFLQKLLIEKTNFLLSSYMHRALDMINVQLIFKGPILFHKIRIEDSLISTTGGNIVIYKHLNISRITGKHLISLEEFSNINMMESALICITCLSNESKSEMFTTHSFQPEKHVYPLYPPCYFQFYGNHTGNNKHSQMIIMKADTY